VPVGEAVGVAEGDELTAELGAGENVRVGSAPLLDPLQAARLRQPAARTTAISVRMRIRNVYQIGRMIVFGVAKCVDRALVDVTAS
jgi:hypothetical protein